MRGRVPHGGGWLGESGLGTGDDEGRADGATSAALWLGRNGASVQWLKAAGAAVCWFVRVRVGQVWRRFKRVRCGRGGWGYGVLCGPLAGIAVRRGRGGCLFLRSLLIYSLTGAQKRPDIGTGSVLPEKGALPEGNVPPRAGCNAPRRGIGSVECLFARVYFSPLGWAPADITARTASPQKQFHLQFHGSTRIFGFRMGISVKA